MTKKPQENPFDKMSKTRRKNQENLENKAMNVDTLVPVEEPRKSKGRPCEDESRGKKRNYCKTINIAVPMEIMKSVNEYALLGRKTNLTEYVNKLILKDLEKNMEKYKEVISKSEDYFD